jgi:general secretion pathway protein D
MLALMLFAPGAGAQTQPTEGKAVDAKPSSEVYQTFYLTNVLQQNDLSDIQTDLRNVLPKARIYGLPSQNAISMRATPEDIQLAQKIIADLDRPRKVYRLT